MMTVIIITHSREMMEIADQIVVLDQGRIVEQGRFEELVDSGGPLEKLLSGGEWIGETEIDEKKRAGINGMRQIDWRGAHGMKKGKGRMI